MAQCHFQTCSERAMRSNNQPLFPFPAEDKRYYIRAEVHKEKHVGSLDSTETSDLSIEWNRDSAPYKSKVSSTCRSLPTFYSLTAKSTHKCLIFFFQKCL